MSVSVYFQEFKSGPSGVILHHLIFSRTIGSFHHHQEFSKETRWVHFFFALCYTRVMKIETHNANLLANYWFIDDGCVLDTPGLLAAVIKLIQSDSPSLGLHINLEKSEVVYLNKKVESDDFFPEQISKHDNRYLRVPVGPATHTLAFLKHKVEKAAIRLMEMLEQLDDPQVAYTLLRTCVSFGKFCYYIRIIPPSLVREAELSFDDCVRSCFQLIISSILSDSQWMQCTLDLKHGGLGLRKVSEHANATYIASVISNYISQSRIIFTGMCLQVNVLT